MIMLSILVFRFDKAWLLDHAAVLQWILMANLPMHVLGKLFAKERGPSF